MIMHASMKFTWNFTIFVLICMCWATAQQFPRVFLFENQTNEASFNLFIGGNEPCRLSLVTNENISSLIVDPDSSSFTRFIVEVTNATSQESEAIQITTDIVFDSSLIIGDETKTFVYNFADRSGSVSQQNLSIILSTLEYIVDLPSTSVGETRIVRVFVYDDGSNDTYRGLPSTATLTLQQDNIASPVFNETNYRISVVENATVNSVILAVNATDEAGPVRYELVNNSMPFGVNLANGEIYVNAPLDFEDTSTYKFEVQAIDLDQFNPLTATALVRIFITDINDEPPVFVDCIPYRCNLTAQEEVFIPLMPIISATDIDTVGDPLTYNFSQADYQSVSQFFSINSTTGQISIIGRLDYDTGHQNFTFTVTSFDGDLTGMATIFIQVLDGEDFVPSIFPLTSETCYNLDIGTTMVVLNPDMFARDNSLQLTGGIAQLTQDSVS